jgi:hypothetical protein
MLKTETERVGRIVDARLSVIEDKVDVFVDEDDHHKIKAARDRLYDLKRALRKRQQDLILVTFRAEVKSYKDSYKESPTTVLMNYRDFSDLIDEYNRSIRDTSEKKVFGYVSEVFIDGIRIRKGCDQKPGELRFYSFE